MDLNWLQTVIIAIVEGLTEFLPVSSTGHMIITQQLLGVESTAFTKAFTVIIQFGAILSVVVLYWRKFFVLHEARPELGVVMSFLSRFGFYWKLLVGFLPAAFFGFIFNKQIDQLLGSVEVVAVMLLIGGIFMLFIDRMFGNGAATTPLTYRRSFVIGLFQCLAMVPGVSRSMATIVGGMAQKLTRKDAAEFSFFLAVPTMFGATCLELYKMLKDGESAILFEGNNLTMLLLGCLVSFIVAILAIRFFIGFLTRHGFAAFGWYRIAIGLLLIGLMLAGVDLKMVD